MKKRILFLVSFIALNALAFNTVLSKDINVKAEEKTEFLRVKFNNYGEFDIHTQLQKSYINDSVSSAPNYAKGVAELSKPVPCAVSWNVETNISDPIDRYLVSLSEYPTMEEAKTYVTTSKSIDFKNLKVGTRYYYTVSPVVKDSTYSSEVASFTTKNSTPRNIDVDGVTNVRDLGGYTTQSGKKVKQGLVYRCGQLNERYVDTLIPYITNKGKDTMLNELGIKSEIDLRVVENNEICNLDYSVLGRNVNFYIRHLGYDIFNSYKNETEIIRDIFRVFGNRNNYPIIFHCAIGTDRTGVVAFFLNSLLGVSQNDIFKDYMFSNFGNIGSPRDLGSVQEHLKFLNTIEGATLSDKAYNYFLSIGLTKQELDTIRDVMLTD